MVTVDELLRGKLEELTTLDGMGGLNLRCNGKGPASLALADFILVADGPNGTLFAPINTVRVVSGQVRVFRVPSLHLRWHSVTKEVGLLSMCPVRELIVA